MGSALNWRQDNKAFMLDFYSEPRIRNVRTERDPHRLEWQEKRNREKRVNSGRTTRTLEGEKEIDQSNQINNARDLFPRLRDDEKFLCKLTKMLGGGGSEDDLEKVAGNIKNKTEIEKERIRKKLEVREIYLSWVALKKNPTKSNGKIVISKWQLCNSQPLYTIDIFIFHMKWGCRIPLISRPSQQQ